MLATAKLPARLAFGEVIVLRDPFYRDIEDGMKRQLVPEVFERCAQDLLREIYPGLVPVRGGSDAGMDGGVADLTAEPFPLVSTTGDATRNLRQSLSSYLKEGGQRRRVIFATSKVLTPPTGRSLHKLANLLGFTLLQIHDGADFANRLYRHPDWCKELLGLSGRPSLLSRELYSRRLDVAGEIVGRERELSSLQGLEGDGLVIGQPGAGKSSLLRALANLRNDSFFLTTEYLGSEEQLAEDIRRLHPSQVLVDDAHANIDSLTRLITVRRQILAEFEIVASSWPTGHSQVMRTLRLTKEQTVRLDRLTRDNIKQILEAYLAARSLLAPPRLLRELIDQAGGQPGLAITLAQLSADGRLDEVLTGDVLRDDLFDQFDDTVSWAARDLLAAIALGGASGLQLSAAARCLEIPISEARRIITQLSAAGVVKESNVNLVVVPPPLRHSLANATFFSGPSSIDPQDVLGECWNKDDAAIELAFCRGRGGQVPEALLERAFERVESSTAWRALAALGPREAAWIISCRPDRIAGCEGELLDSSPDKMLPLLLKPHAYPNSSEPETGGIAKIRQWIEGITPENEACVSCRLALMTAVEEFVASGGKLITAFNAVQYALDPSYHSAETDVGSGNTFTVRFGLLKLRHLEQVAPLWDRVLNLLPPGGITNWSPITAMVEKWAHPLHNQNHQPDVDEFLLNGAKSMLMSLRERFPKGLGLARWAIELAGILHLEERVEVDPDFMLLYPAHDRRISWRSHCDAVHERIALLAERWKGLEPTVVAAKLHEYDSEANSVGIGERFTPFLASRLAQLVDLPVDWAKAFVEQRLSEELLGPFLWQASRLASDNPIADDLIMRCLEDPVYRTVAAICHFSTPVTTSERTLIALDTLAESAKSCEIWIARGEIARENVQLLLKSQHIGLQLAAIWGISEDGILTESSDEDANFALKVLVNETQPYRLMKLFGKHPGFAFAWLSHDIENQIRPEGEAIRSAVSCLSQEQRRELIQMADKAGRSSSKSMLILVGTDPDLYRFFLSLNEGSARPCHLEPLAEDSHCLANAKHSQLSSAEWERLAICALDAGYHEEAIVRAALRSCLARNGTESEAWKSRGTHWSALETSVDPRIRSVGKQLCQMAKAGQEDAERLEREAAIWDSK